MRHAGGNAAYWWDVLHTEWLIRGATADLHSLLSDTNLLLLLLLRPVLGI